MSKLDDSEVQVLQEALDDEYRAWATYDQVVADFGEVRPFINIREAEARHMQALLGLFERYGLTAPANSWPGKVERYPSLQAACEAGVVAEIANAEMYERLLTLTQRDDVLEVLRRLQQASQQRHLPAFQRSAQRGGQRGGQQRARQRGEG